MRIGLEYLARATEKLGIICCIRSFSFLLRMLDRIMYYGGCTGDFFLSDQARQVSHFNQHFGRTFPTAVLPYLPKKAKISYQLEEMEYTRKGSMSS